MMHNVVQTNDVYMCTGITGELGAQTAAQRSNTFSGNRYRVPSLTGNSWKDSTSEAWSAWQAAGNDTAGSSVTPCAFP